MNEQTMPTLQDVLAARPNVYRTLQPTPLHHYPTLSQLIGAEVWIKHENHQPIGAFKVRGGLNYAATFEPGRTGRRAVYRFHGQSRPVDRLRGAGARHPGDDCRAGGGQSGQGGVHAGFGCRSCASWRRL